MVERMNSDLANTLGNLVNRTIAMSNKYFGGAVTNPASFEASFTEEEKAVDADLKAVVTGTIAKVAAKMEQLRVADSLTEIFNLFKRCNKYIDETEPWKLAKDEAKQDRLKAVLYNLLEGIYTGTALAAPFMPGTAEKIFAQINAPVPEYDTLETWGKYPDGGKVTAQPEILFARMDIKDLAERVNALHPGTFVDEAAEAEAAAKAERERKKAEKAAKKAAAKAKAEAAKAEAAGNAAAENAGEENGSKPVIKYDDFDKLEFRVGEILECRRVENSEKLLCSQVKIGEKVVQICSGIQKFYTPEEMVGRKVMVLVNLKPRKMAGLLSEGMLLCAESPDGKLALMSPADAEMPAGSLIC